MKILNSLILLLFAVSMASAQDNFLKNLMESKPEYFDKIIKNNDKYEVQIVYTQINRNKNNKPSFETHSYNLDANHYFYPASTVKLPACLLALEKVNNLKISGLSKNSAMVTKADFENQTEVKSDSTAANGLPSIAHYIKKILLVSDNDAFNRLYEFIGQKDFNLNLRKKGLNNTRIIHRLEAGMNIEQNKNTNPIDFFNDKDLIYSQESAKNTLNFFPNEKIKRGIGYMNNDNILVKEPLDFTYKNKFSLADQHQLLKALIFPTSVKKSQRFNLSESDYQFIYKYMSMLPNESAFPKYAKPEYYPSYCKFLLFGSEKELDWPKNVRIFNKVGDAYGFLLDNAYIVDFEKNIEFMLSVVIHCNNDQIYNDDKYDYDEIGFPFMKHLGQLLYDFELNRAPKNKPNLEKLKINYRELP
jgi:hypothetical protein